MAPPPVTGKPPVDRLSRSQLLELYGYMKLNRMVE